ncbi:hypothetical protein [Burkholderia cenocepacia]|uniref:hypothetical protein n=1 Tax=Burkholderia cenocepacia TaxID=95486 RepID=UPI00209AB9A1|nr:hypothetical protein [Burkholderia cenocepacia]
MLFAIKVDYTRPAEEVHAHLESHKAWLVKHVQAGSILFAGPLKGEAAGFFSRLRGPPERYRENDRRRPVRYSPAGDLRHPML